jgi:hypothetical protein
MVEHARRKAAASGVDVEVTVADAASPDSPARSTDVVLIRHLAWTLPYPETAIKTWASLLRSHGRLVMVEGRWATTAQANNRSDATAIDHGDYTPVYRNLPWYGGVGADTLVPLLGQTFNRVDYHDLSTDDDLWGQSVSDERYAIVAHLDHGTGVAGPEQRLVVGHRSADVVEQVGSLGSRRLPSRAPRLGAPPSPGSRPISSPLYRTAKTSGRGVRPLTRQGQPGRAAEEMLALGTAACAAELTRDHGLGLGLGLLDSSRA